MQRGHLVSVAESPVLRNRPVSKDRVLFFSRLLQEKQIDGFEHRPRGDGSIGLTRIERYGSVLSGEAEDVIGDKGRFVAIVAFEYVITALGHRTELSGMREERRDFGLGTLPDFLSYESIVFSKSTAPAEDDLFPFLEVSLGEAFSLGSVEGNGSIVRLIRILEGMLDTKRVFDRLSLKMKNALGIMLRLPKRLLICKIRQGLSIIHKRGIWRDVSSAGSEEEQRKEQQLFSLFHFCISSNALIIALLIFTA